MVIQRGPSTLKPHGLDVLLLRGKAMTAREEPKQRDGANRGVEVSPIRKSPGYRVLIVLSSG